MLRSILLASDGVTPDDVALDCACDIAIRHGAVLDFVMAPDRGDIDGGEAHGIGGGTIAEHRDQVLTARLNAYLDEERAELMARLSSAGITPNIRELTGDPAEALAAASEAADLLVLSHAKLAVRAKDAIETGFVLPIDRVLQQVVRPVLLVGEEPIGKGPVAVAYDGSVGAQRALHAGLLSGLFEDRPVVVLSVGYGVAAADAMASPAATLARRHRHDVTIEALEGHGEASDEILQALEVIQPGLFVSGCFGEKGLLDWIVGGTTDQLLPHVRMPWLVQR
jgi:nucleotide-binding universal stress UspA family protein